MSQGGSGACFLEEAAAAVLLRHVFRRQDFQCDDALELVVVSLVDRTHAPGADGLDDSVMGDGRDRNGLHGWNYDTIPTQVFGNKNQGRRIVVCFGNHWIGAAYVMSAL
jgi:hypothetical protein